MKRVTRPATGRTPTKRRSPAVIRKKLLKWQQELEAWDAAGRPATPVSAATARAHIVLISQALRHIVAE